MGISRIWFHLAHRGTRTASIGATRGLSGGKQVSFGLYETSTPAVRRTGLSETVGVRGVLTSSRDIDGRDPPPAEESITHLYDARGIVEKWLGHPTFWGMLSEDALAKGEASKDGPPGEGPVLRWQTRIVLEPGGDGFHPANRKVSVAVYVKELGLSRNAKTRLLALVGKRYNRDKDELIIISERYEHREENRKDVLRTLIALMKEAKQGVEEEGGRVPLPLEDSQTT